MSNVTFTLKHGLKLGDDLLKEVTLREVRTGDLIEAQEESEKLVYGPNGGEFVPSPALMNMHVLRRQIVSIDNFTATLTPAMFKQLHPDDFAMIQQQADLLEQASVNVVKEGPKRGRSDTAAAGR